jgi:hypothetical protein
MSVSKQKVLEELRRLAFVTAYFFVFMSAMAIFRAAILSHYSVEPVRVAMRLVEALAYAKIVLLGDMLHLGRHAPGRPLALMTLQNTGIFAAFVVAFTVLEHVVVGLVHGERPVLTLSHILHQGAPELLVRVMLMLLAFLPMFALWETSKALGGNTLYRLFFPRAREA